jgi:hypothetical protein
MVTIRQVLEQLVTPGTKLNRLYKHEQWDKLVDAILEYVEESGAELKSTQYPDDIMYDIFERFKRSYEKNKDFDSSAAQFLHWFTGLPEERMEHVYTEHPPIAEFLPGDYPTNDELNQFPAHFTSREKGRISPKTDSLLLRQFRDFRRNKNPLSAIEAFFIAHDRGLYPPLWALNYLATLFKAFYEGKGSKSLDDLFGFKLRRGQRTGPFKRALIEKRDEILCRNIAILTQHYHYGLDKACQMETKRLRKYVSFDSCGYKIKTDLSWNTIKDIYLKRRAKVLKLSELQSNDETPKLTKKERKTFLSKYS